MLPEPEPENTIEASKFPTPVILANQVQIIQLQDSVILEFRMILPQVLLSEKGSEVKKYHVKADLTTLPPTARLAIDPRVAKELMDQLNQVLNANEAK